MIYYEVMHKMYLHIRANVKQHKQTAQTDTQRKPTDTEVNTSRQKVHE